MPIHFSTEQLDRAVRDLRFIPEGVARAAVPALNRASLAARTAGLRRLMATYAMSRATVASTVRMTKATRANLTAEFGSRGSRLALAEFRVSPRRRTVRGESFGVMVRRDGGTEVKRGFLQTIKGGRLAVLQRAGARRYPIRMAFGPAAPQMLDEPGVREEIEARAMQVLSSRFEHEVGRVLKGAVR